jgi:hypothetical protein
MTRVARRRRRRRFARPSRRRATDDGATPWIAIAGALGGACALLGAGATLTGRIRLRSAA